MNLRVDDARQHVQALAIDNRFGACSPKIAKRRDAPVAHTDIRCAHAVLVHDDAVSEDRIVGLHAFDLFSEMCTP